MKIILGIFATLALTFTAFAEDKSYGCGLGTMVAKEKSLISTTTAAVVDYLVPVRASATTTGTSGCERHNLVMLQKPGAKFALVNYAMIEMDAAQGGGEHLSSFAFKMGCSFQDQQKLNDVVQKNFVELFNENSNGIEFYKKLTDKLNGQSSCGMENA